MFILRGVSGAGKSTLAELFQEFPSCEVCTADDFFYNEKGEYQFEARFLGAAHRECREKAETAAKHGKMIVIANTNCKEQDFKEYVSIAENYDYEITYLVIENRHGNDSVHNVPQSVRDNQEINLRNSLVLQ